MSASYPTPALRILIADDNPVNRMVLGACLRSLGYESKAVADGRAVLQAMEEESFDIIFMDLHMPVMSGFEAASGIRKKGSDPERPWIVALTATAGPNDRQGCLSHGMNDLVLKPAGTPEISRILELVTRKRFCPEAPEQKETAPPERTPGPSDDTDLPCPPVCLERLLENCAGRKDFAEKLIRIFLQRFPHDLQEILMAAAGGHPEKVVSVAHRLKGTAATIAADSLHRKADELERLASQEILGEPASEAVRELECLAEQIRRFHKSLAS